MLGELERNILKYLYRNHVQKTVPERRLAHQLFRELGIPDGTDLSSIRKSHLINIDEHENISITREGLDYISRVETQYKKLAGRMVDGRMENHDKENRAFVRVGKEIEIEQSRASHGVRWYKKPEIVVPALVAVIAALIGAPWWTPLLQLDKEQIQAPNSEEQRQLNARTSTQTIGDATSSYDKLTSLRPLEPLETGKKIGDLPNGVYFYSSALGVEFEIDDPKFDFISATNRNSYGDYFEIQKIENRYYVIGFISDEAFSKIGLVSKGESLYTILFPNQWGGAKNPVAIPFDATYTVRSRTVDLDEKTRIDILDIGFKEVMDNAAVHGTGRD